MPSPTPSLVDPSRLLTFIDRFANVRVAVFGDLIVDEFIYGDIARVSREAPVLILNYDSTEIVPGGAGNAASNVAALGGSAIAIGFTGQDETGRRLLETLRPRVDVRPVLRPKGFRTPTKTRILAGGIHSAKQQVVRIDRRTRRIGLRRRARMIGRTQYRRQSHRRIHQSRKPQATVGRHFFDEKIDFVAAERCISEIELCKGLRGCPVNGLAVDPEPRADAFVRLMTLGFQQFAAHHRRQGQRNNCRDDD